MKKNNWGKKRKSAWKRVEIPTLFWEQGLCPHCYCWFKGNMSPGAALCTHCGRAEPLLPWLGEVSDRWWKSEARGDCRTCGEFLKVTHSVCTNPKSPVTSAHFKQNDVISLWVKFSTMIFCIWTYISHTKATKFLRAKPIWEMSILVVWSFRKESSILADTWPPNCSGHCNFQEPQLTWVWRTGCCICYFCSVLCQEK